MSRTKESIISEIMFEMNKSKKTAEKIYTEYVSKGELTALLTKLKNHERA